MTPFPVWRAFLLLALLVSSVAKARDAQGLLDIIVTPNNGVPALVRSGDSFESTLTAKADLSLVGNEGAVALDVVWEELPDKRWKARCKAAGQVAPGTYALEATTSNKTDRNVRSVFVFDAFPDTYVVAHMSGPHIGSAQRARAPEAIFEGIAATVNAATPALVIITGNLTQTAAPTEFRRSIEVLDKCSAPTFVCPGAGDGKGTAYEAYFGVSRYWFWFGKDGYLGFGSSSPAPTDLGTQPADLYRFRRALMPARWAIGFTHQYDPAVDMRAQLILFVDDPLDLLLAGAPHRANGEKERIMPWGHTALSIAPVAMDGALQFIDVSPTECRPRPVEIVVPVK